MSSFFKKKKKEKKIRKAGEEVRAELFGDGDICLSVLQTQLYLQNSFLTDRQHKGANTTQTKSYI